jgi:uncharacterized protein (DUF58 family)
MSDLLSARAAGLAKELEFFARTRVEGYLKSNNASKRKGQSTDFIQHREYLPGDDLRSVDWRVLAKTDRLVTREYEEYTNLDLIIGLDFSGSMAYPDSGQSKIAFSRRMAAMLSYLLVHQRDAVGLAAMNTQIIHYLRPATSRRHLAELFRALVSVTPEGDTDLAVCIRQLLGQVRRRAVFVFFSDCFQDPAALTKALGILTVRGHDVVLYQVYHGREKELDLTGFTLFRDLETGQVDPADPLEIKTAYKDVFAEHQRRLREGTARYEIEFHSVEVSENWEDNLANLLRLRSRRT